MACRYLKEIHPETARKLPRERGLSRAWSAFEQNRRDLCPSAGDCPGMQSGLDAVNHRAAMRKLEFERPHLLDLPDRDTTKFAVTTDHRQRLEQPTARSATLVRRQALNFVDSRNHPIRIDKTNQDLAIGPPRNARRLWVELTHCHDRWRQFGWRDAARPRTDIRPVVFAGGDAESIPLALRDDAFDDDGVASLVARLDILGQYTKNRHADILEFKACNDEESGGIGVLLEELGDATAR